MVFVLGKLFQLWAFALSLIGLGLLAERLTFLTEYDPTFHTLQLFHVNQLNNLISVTATYTNPVFFYSLSPPLPPSLPPSPF